MTDTKNFNDQFVPQPQQLGLSAIIRGTWLFLRDEIWLFLLVIVLGVVAALSDLLGIGLLLPFFDTMSNRSGDSLASGTIFAPVVTFFSSFEESDRIAVLAWCMAGLVVFRQIISYANAQISMRARQSADTRLRKEVLQRLMYVDLRWYYRQKLAELFTILHSFTGYAGTVLMSVLTIIPQIFVLAVYIAVMFSVSVKLTIACVAIMPFIFLALSSVTHRRHAWARRQKDIAISINGVGFEALSALKAIRLFGQEGPYLQRFNRLVDDNREAHFNINHYHSLSSAGFQALSWVAMALLITLGAQVLRSEGQGWLDLVLVFIFTLSRISGPASIINAQRVQLGIALPSAEQLHKFLEATADLTVPDGKASVPTSSFDIRFENVHFRYSNDQCEVLKGLDLFFAHGKTTAIVGPSGAGKSTLVDLLVKMHVPTEGRIMAGDTDLSLLNSASWRSQIAVVSQDAFIFNDTAAKNISFGRPQATSEEIRLAARLANAEVFLEGLPERYETILGERGVRLSGGQAQRIAIARAFLLNPRILILDEATSAQDSESEQLVQQAIGRLSENRTVIIIAHRLSTVMSADKIVFLEGGRIVETGSHVELIAKGGRYANFVRLQDLSMSVSEPAQPFSEEAPAP